MKYKTLFLDLDGTITESGPGIMNSVEYALNKMKVDHYDRSYLPLFIGPPLLESFQKFYGMTYEEAQQAIVCYREYYEEKGMLENSLYPGIMEELQKLREEGRKLYVATSKPEIYAKRIAKALGFEQDVDLIFGASFDEARINKSGVIRYALQELGINRTDNVLMIGDRMHDVEGAAENKIPCLGVAYGYGSREELLDAGAVEIAALPTEIQQKIHLMEEE